MRKNHRLLAAWAIGALVWGVLLVARSASHDDAATARLASGVDGDGLELASGRDDAAERARREERARRAERAPRSGGHDDAAAASSSTRGTGARGASRLVLAPSRRGRGAGGSGARSRGRIPPNLQGVCDASAKSAQLDRSDDLSSKLTPIVGKLASATPSAIAGWAYDPTNADNVVNVDIYVDSELVATVPANGASQQVPDPAGVTHVFTCPTPASMNDGDKHSIAALGWGPDGESRYALRSSPLAYGGTQPPAGKLLWASRNLVFGWALDPNAPGAPVTVQVLGDGVLLGSVTTQGTGHNGELFAQALAVAPPQRTVVALDGISGPDDPNLAATLAASEQTIIQTSRYNAMIPLSTLASGQAWDELDFVAPVAGGTLVALPAATAAAIKFSQPSDDAQAFAYQPSQPIAASWIQVLVQSADGSLVRQAKHSPMQIGPGSNQLPTGAVTTVNDTQVAGWAADADVIPAPIQVDVFVDGTHVSRLAADQPFPAVQGFSPPLPDPDHGFVFTPPQQYCDGKAHIVQVFAVNQPDGVNPELPGSPASFVGKRDQPPTGSLDGATATSATGWAYDPDAGAALISVEIWMDGAYCSTVTANQSRPDLVPVFAPDPAHGFTAALPAAAADGNPHVVHAYALDVPGGPEVELPGSPRTVNNQAPYLGIRARDISSGLAVAAVTSGSPAAVGGMVAGDMIHAYDDQTSPLTVSAFNSWLQTKQAGEQVVFRLARSPALVAPPPPNPVPPANPTPPLAPTERLVVVTLGPS